MGQVTPPDYLSRLGSWSYECLQSQVTQLNAPLRFSFPSWDVLFTANRVKYFALAAIVLISTSYLIRTLRGVNSSQKPANGQQPNLPTPQPITEAEIPLTERAVEVVSNVPQAIKSNAEEMTCTPKEFEQFLFAKHRFPPKVVVTDDLEFHMDNYDDPGFQIDFDEALYLPKDTSWPESLEVRGDLTLRGIRLTSLPQRLKVRDSLDLRRTYLTTLPEGLEVGGNLHLSDTRLTSLPQRLKVGGYLDLSDTCLTSLPEEGLEVGCDLSLTRCRSLTSLPSWITTLGAYVTTVTTRNEQAPNGITRSILEDRNVHLEATGLSDAIIERLRQAHAPGMRFHFSHAATNPTVQFPNLETALAFWWKEAKDEALAIPNIIVGQKFDRINVVRFLARLTTTAEYENLQTRPYLACRVIEAFNQLALGDELKARACIFIHQGLTSCDDRIISALEEIELMLLLDKIEKTNHTADELKKLGKSFLHLEMVNAKAKAYKETLTWIDEIEIYLAFQIGLAERFNLPVKTRNMFFRRCAQVTDAQLKAFGNEIEQACTDEKLDDFLNTWSPWLKFQRQFVPAYEELAVADRVLAADDICVLTGYAPEQPVLCNGHVYEYVDFAQQYRINGTDPLDRSKIDISQLKRLIKKII